MFNLLRTEFYKLRKSKSFKVVFIIAIVMAALTVMTTYFMENYLSEEILSGLSSLEEYNIGLNISNDINSVFGNKSGIGIFFTSFANDVNQLLIIIFSVLFITQEYSSGSYKNMIGKGFSRSRLYVSKLIAVCLANFLLLFVTAISSALTGTIIWGVGSIEGSITGSILAYIGIQLFVHTAFISLIMALTIWFRSNGIAIALNVCMILFVPLFVSGLGYVFKQTSGFSRIWIYNHATAAAGNEIASTTFYYAILVSVIYLIVTITAGLSIFQRQDIK